MSLLSSWGGKGGMHRVRIAGFLKLYSLLASIISLRLIWGKGRGQSRSFSSSWQDLETLQGFS